MVSQYEVDSHIKDMMDSLTWVVIPLLNVDGYEYSWTDVRKKLWL